jgi:hypothetical protein
VSRFSPEITASVIGLAAFQLWQSWRDVAPSFQELRQAPGDDFDTRQRLMDADLSVGSLALIIGIAFGILSHDYTALILMLVIFGTLSLWSHQIQAAPSSL